MKFDQVIEQGRDITSEIFFFKVMQKMSKGD